MSMSTRVVGFVPPDEKFRKMLAVWNACKTAKVPVPRDVEEFFDDRDPDENGMEVDVPVTKWNTEYQQGYELKVADIPKNVSVIRFFNSW